jgi:hypothetical protein
MEYCHCQPPQKTKMNMSLVTSKQDCCITTNTRDTMISCLFMKTIVILTCSKLLKILYQPDELQKHSKYITSS